MTPEKRGQSICILVRRAHFVKNETWDNFTPIPMKPAKDEDVFKWLANDGLKLGEWITVPDPFQDEWPFERRHPGATFPPDPMVQLWCRRTVDSV